MKRFVVTALFLSCWLVSAGVMAWEPVPRLRANGLVGGAYDAP